MKLVKSLFLDGRGVEMCVHNSPYGRLLDDRGSAFTNHIYDTHGKFPSFYLLHKNIYISIFSLFFCLTHTFYLSLSLWLGRIGVGVTFKIFTARLPDTLLKQITYINLFLSLSFSLSLYIYIYIYTYLYIWYLIVRCLVSHLGYNHRLILYI